MSLRSRIWAAAAIALLAIGIALLVPSGQSCASGETLTTTGWNEAAPRCYTMPISELARGTPPQEHSRVEVQAAVVAAGVVLSAVVLAVGKRPGPFS